MMGQVSQIIEGDGYLQPYQINKNPVLAKSWFENVLLRGQGGLKNGPVTEFLLLGGNLSLVSP